MSRSVALAGATCIVLAVSGCGLFGKEEKVPPCPKVYLAEETSTLTRFKPGGGHDLTDVQFEVDLLGYDGGCTYETKKKNLIVRLNVQFIVARGPASGREAPFNYFVAIPKLFPSEAGKRTFDVAFPFQQNAGRGQFRDEIELDIPLADQKTGPSYEIYLGIQLSPDELDYNRKQREKSRQ